MFTPRPIADEAFYISGKAIADTSRAEVKMVRAEAALLAENNSALREIIACLEAISTIRIDGCNPNPKRLFELKLLSRDIVGKGSEDALEALRYKGALEWCAQNVQPGDDFTKRLMKDINQGHSRTDVKCTDVKGTRMLRMLRGTCTLIPPKLKHHLPAIKVTLI
jgi:hypothetical protein